MLSQFERIRVINLPERTDRRREMEQELAAIGLADDPRVAFFAAIRPESRGAFTSIGARGVYESQHSVLREAATLGVSVLILEDDCQFTSEIRDYESGNDWDIFYGGYYADNAADLAASDIVGAHMMGFSARGARLVYQHLNNLRFEGVHPPIDAAYVWFRRANPQVPTRFAVPPLAIQRASRSDIAEMPWFDRVPGLRELASQVRRFKRQRPC